MRGTRWVCRSRGWVARPAAVSLVLVFCLVLLPWPGSSRAATSPTLTILSPTEGDTIGNGSPVVVVFNVSGFVLVQPGRIGEVASPTEGYLNVTVDGAPAQLVTRVEPITLPLPPGPHTIELELFLSNMTPLSPDVSAVVHVVTTDGPATGIPALRIVSPTEGEPTGHDVYVYVAVFNFTIVDAHGQPNAPNEGHVQLLRGGVFQQDLGASTFGFLVDMPDGNNTITAQLVNNDGTPLTPGVSANVSIFVKIAADPSVTEAVTGGLAIVLAVILVVLLYRRRKATARVLGTEKPEP